MEFTGFGKGALSFFDELASNNNKQWWLDNKDRYETEIRVPLEALLAELAAEFGEAKVFRPYRDVRFSSDKSPYKTQAAAVIHTEGNPSALYLALSAQGLSVGGGLYMPATDQLTRMREAVDNEETGSALVGIIAGLDAAKAEVGARETLKTAPRGYSNDHPRIGLLRMKGITAMFDHGPRQWLYKREAADRVGNSWRALKPLNEWLDENVGLTTLPHRGR